MTDTDMKKKRVMVVFTGNPQLFPKHVDLLNDLFGPMNWGILSVPPDGQTKEVPDGISNKERGTK